LRIDATLEDLMARAGWRTLVVMATLVLSASVITVAQQQPPQQQKTINRVPIAPTSMASGEEMYSAYCAACHGKEGRGNGPAASAFKTPPTNLTTLTAKNKGKYPEMDVMSVLQWGPNTTNAHGSKDMPVWGTLFSSLGDQAQTRQRLYNLTKYVESLQGTH
jgi:mono/diheme cytochrome c family protein